MEMEQVISSLVSSLGVSGIGFAFMYMMLKQTFKMQEDSISKLCNKIDRLVDESHKLILKDVEKTEQTEYYTREVTESYIKISNKIEAQNTKIDSIFSVVENIKGQKTALGMIAVNKGYITKEQLQECLEEQKSLQGGF